MNTRQIKAINCLLEHAILSEYISMNEDTGEFYLSSCGDNIGLNKAELALDQWKDNIRLQSSRITGHVRIVYIHDSFYWFYENNEWKTFNIFNLGIPQDDDNNPYQYKSMSEALRVVQTIKAPPIDSE